MATTIARRRSRTTLTTTVTALAAALALTGCSAIGGGGGGTVTLVTHDSFSLPDEMVETFESETGITLETIAPGDAGSLVNQLVLTKDAPLGDAVFGIDNAFASRVVEEGVLDPYASPAAGADAEEYAVGAGDHLTAIDVGDVCVNLDREWFAENGVPEPGTLEDLTDPAYADLLVVTNPATSSPGLAFLLATVARFGEDGWLDYWAALDENGLKVVDGWADAYFVDFSGSEGQGDRPLALSYASSPPYEVPDGADEAPTSAMLDTCFRQVEYAGVLAGAENPEGARKVVDWLLSPQVQAAIPENMFMYPVDSSVELPEQWARFAPQPSSPVTIEPEVITEKREEWIDAWTDAVVG